MKPASLALALAIAAFPTVAPVQAQGLATDEQIILKQVMTDKKMVYSQNLQLTDSESRAFWPIYDEYMKAGPRWSTTNSSRW